MKTKLYFTGRLFLFVLALACTQFSYSQQIARSLTGSNGVFIGFLEYKPVDYNANPQTKYPLIIFLHGIGERGNGTTDLLNVAANAIPRYIAAGSPMRFYVNGQWQTFLVISPQLAPHLGNWPPYYVEEMIKYAKQNLRVDTNRIYLTGLSLGGGGVWGYVNASVSNAKQVAAIAPVCGTCDWSSNICNLAQANTPVWAFHAVDDGLVGVGCTTGAIGMLNACNPLSPTPPKMTIYPNGNHFIWDMAYDTLHNWQSPVNIYEWFLNQTRSTLPPNVLPVANAGADQTISLPTNSVNLSGSGSSDPDGSITSYSWTKISGPSSFTIGSANSVNTTISNLAQGVYSFQLTVTDNVGASSSDVVSITVLQGANLSPIANAGSDQLIHTPTSSITLNGSGSSDPDGSVASYSWTKVSGPASSNIISAGSVSTQVNNLVQGVYVFRLSVTDNLGATGTATVSVTVNTVPVAQAGADQVLNLPTNTALLVGSGSYDVDGTIASFVWSQVNGPSPANLTSVSGSNAQAVSLIAGVYNFRVAVTDNRGAVAYDTMKVTVINSTPNTPPVANAGTDQSITLPTSTISLNGTGSTDADGTINSYAWTKISGPASSTIVNANAATTAVNNLTQGTYSFRLFVTDNNGGTDDDTVVIVVNPAPPPPNVAPVARAGSDQSITLPTNSITIDGSGSTDSDGTISSYVWTKISGPASSTIVNANSATTAVNNLAQGTYSFRLVVTDNSGASDDDTVLVTVNPVPPPTNVAPIANAGANQSITLPVNTVTLNGSASSDPDGTISSYSWSKISGPASYNIANGNSVSTAINNLTQGTYSFRLVVTDNNGASDDDTVVIAVNPAPPPPNVSPNANAGADQSITLPTNTSTLDGSSSSDPDGTIVSYSWTRISGPSSYNIVSGNAATTAVNNLTQGTYSFRLVVTDNNGATSSDTVVIVVNPAPPPANVSPVANAGSDQSITLPSNSVTLDGSGSSDPDGSIVSYSWTKIAGPSSYNIANGNSATTSVNSLTQGTYSFRLVVTDNNGATSSDTVVIVVNPAPPPANVSPVANAGSDQSITLPSNTVTVDGSGSSDPDGSIVSYSWTKIAGPASYNIANGNSATTSVGSLTQGTYSFRLVVTDNSGATDSDTVTVVVNPAPPPANVSPNANAGSDQSITLPTNSVTLDGSASSDPDGTIAFYSWTKISGPGAYNIVNGNGSTTIVNGLTQGTYSFRLSVSDNSGASDDDTVVVNVNPAPPPPNVLPVANAGIDQTITLPTNSVTLDGSGSGDVDGTIISYAWSKVSGPASFTINNGTSPTTTVTNLFEGTYVFRLVVTDNSGGIAEDFVSIVVQPRPNQLPVANAGNDVNVILPAASRQLNGSASYDPDGTIVSYSWTRVSGPAGLTIVSSTTATPIVVGLIAGEYVFHLTVTDNDGATASDDVKVTVLPIQNLPPVARAGRDTTIAIPASAVWLNGTSSSDPDGNITRFQWRQVAGPSASIIANNALPITSANNLQPGDYLFELVVTDNDGEIGKDSMYVSVVNNFRFEEELTISPNPVQGVARLKCVSDSTGILMIRILDMNGTLVRSYEAVKGQSHFEQEINLVSLNPGTYYVEAIISNKKRMVRKFLKQ